MENVIRQGYLKKGNSVDAGRLSGIFEKISPRKWYMLVVRNRVPYLEQYDRDVDVFHANPPLVAYDLSVCTSISRTMSTTARTFNFVIVLPDELIDLVAATREEMVDWCNKLERTLSSLGFLKRDKEEHIYTFCPAVSNTTGRAKPKSSEEEDSQHSDEELGAVGGVPPPSPSSTPPIRPQPPPPVPTSPSPPILLPRFLSEPAGATSIPPQQPTSSVPPSLPPHPAHKGVHCLSPTETRLTNSAPSSPHMSGPLPPTPARDRPFSIPPPPLPRGRPTPMNGPASFVVNLPSPDKPPPLPPGRPPITGGGDGGGGGGMKERSLPPVPPLPPSPLKDSSSSSAGASSKTEPTSEPDAEVNNSSEEEEESDYSSDFVSGAFWEINRKLPIPSARHARLPPPRQAPPLPDHGPPSASKDEREEEGLDEGYTDLAVTKVQTDPLPKSQTSSSSNNEYTKVNKAAKVKRNENPVPKSGCGTTLSSIEDLGAEQRFESSDSTHSRGPQSSSHRALPSLQASARVSTESSCTPAVTPEPELVVDGEEEETEGNFYAPFPRQCEILEKDGDVTFCSNHQKSENKISDIEKDDYSVINDDALLELHVNIVRIPSSSSLKLGKKSKSSPIPQPPSSDDDDNDDDDDDDDDNDSGNIVPDSMYASACEASTLFPSECVPPLPPRQDSLWTGMTESFCEGASATVFGATPSVPPLPGTSPPSTSPLPAENVQRLIPRRRIIKKSSHPFTQMDRGEENHQEMVSVASDSSMPPAPPPRRGFRSGGGDDIPFAMFQSVDSLDPTPPPLPARRSQSVRSQRPVSMVTSWSASMDNEDCLPASMSESFCGITSLSRQQSFGNGDCSASENHLRQRMLLDRMHSLHSVISLKKSQAEILQQEMDLPGVTVTVTLRAALGIALVDCGNAVCIAGWNQKDFPSLHGKFHIGDQLISVCNIKVMSAVMALKMLKHPPLDVVEMLVRRIPHARVLAIRRAAEGQSIGLQRNGGTAEILYVDPNGLAAENGLPLYAPAVLGSQGQGRAKWVLTEINSRHLNLFFKDNEIEHRLNAVGREITIVAQPSDYIGELKRQLKKIKNYKNFIVQ